MNSSARIDKNMRKMRRPTSVHFPSPLNGTFGFTDIQVHANVVAAAAYNIENCACITPIGRVILSEDRHVERGGGVCVYRDRHGVSPVALEKEGDGDAQQHSGGAGTEQKF